MRRRHICRGVRPLHLNQKGDAHRGIPGTEAGGGGGEGLPLGGGCPHPYALLRVREQTVSEAPACLSGKVQMGRHRVTSEKQGSPSLCARAWLTLHFFILERQDCLKGVEGQCYLMAELE